jgi:hypothetical protein
MFHLYSSITITLVLSSMVTHCPALYSRHGYILAKYGWDLNENVIYKDMYNIVVTSYIGYIIQYNTTLS